MDASGRQSPVRVRIVGCGSSLRSDDQIGLRVAEALQREYARADDVHRHIHILASQAPGAEEFVENLDPEGLLVIIDAAQADAAHPPGTWSRIDYRKEPHRIRAECRTFTHTLSVAAALETADALGLLPATVWIFAVAGANFDYSQEMSSALEEQLTELVQTIRNDVERWMVRRGGS